MKNEEKVKEWMLPQLPFPETPLQSQPHEQIFTEVLEQYRPNLIHVHHLMNWPLSVLTIAKEKSIPIVISLHDYFLLTPEFTWSSQRAVGELTSPRYANDVFNKDVSGYLQSRAASLKDALQGVTLVAPSQYVADIHKEVFTAAIEVIAHGIPRIEYDPNKVATPAFGYIGSFLPQKGFSVLLRAFKRYQLLGGIWNLRLFGGNLAFPVQGVECYGMYQTTQLGGIADKFTVGIVPSVFPETFSLTVSELQLMNKYIIASAIGALPERLSDTTDRSITVTVGDIIALSDAMLKVELKLRSNPTLVPASIPVRTTDQMCKDYVELYERLT